MGTFLTSSRLTWFRCCSCSLVVPDSTPALMEQPRASLDTVPESSRDLRACMFCALVKTRQQFLDTGCENCTFLDLASDPAKVNMCTSPKYTGVCAVLDPPASWAARWKRFETFQPGLYALSVHGEVPSHVLDQL